jgi:hypothetical protein
MMNLMNYPVIVFTITLVVLCLSAKLGSWFQARRKPLDDKSREDFQIVLGATLTLLGLIIGFTFSMAISRYDQRKNLEEDEANAIGTEYVRSDLLPAADADKVKSLMALYLEQRIQFYKSRDRDQLRQINARTAELEDQLWSAVRIPASAQPTPVISLAVAGMNDVLNSQGYTQAAWWNRIPIAAWFLLAAIAVCANLLMGYNVRRTRATLTLLVVPLTVSISFLLIADIDSPRGGIIRVSPNNLASLVPSVHAISRDTSSLQSDRRPVN